MEMPIQIENTILNFIVNNTKELTRKHFSDKSYNLP